MDLSQLLSNIFPQFRNVVIFHQAVNEGALHLEGGYRQVVQHITDIRQGLTGFHKPVIDGFLRRGGRIVFFPVRKHLFITGQRPDTQNQ